MVFQNDIIAGASGAGDDYTIDQSIRFNDDDSPKLSRTPSAGNRTTWTYSVWLKRSNILGLAKDIFSASTNSTNRFEIQFNASEQIRIYQSDSGSTTDDLITTRVFRDPSAWYHIVVRYDTTESTASDRIKIYVNGVQETSFSTANYPTASYEGDVNANVVHTISSRESGGVFFDGYMAEINFVDGTAVEPSSFGETNSDTGQWIAKKYSGSYGTNGFYLTGANSSDFGEDFSGNNNDWTSSGLAAADQMSDSPTNNWCTLNSVSLTSTATLSDGNLTLSNTSTGATTGTLATPSSGKWYFEIKYDSESAAVTSQSVGVVKAKEAYITGTTGGGIYFFTTGLLRVEGVDTGGWGSAWGVGDTIGVAIDLDANKIWFAINNTWQASGNPSAGTNPAASSFSSEPYVALIRNGNASRTTGWTANFGQNAFAYTPPTDFLALNSANLPDPTIVDPSDYFTPYIYTGDNSGTSRVFTGVGFAPNLVWTKARGGTYSHALFDTVRGTNKYLNTDSALAEITNPSSGYLTAFGSDGYTFSDGSSLTNPRANYNAATTYVSWNWKANGTGSSNTDGSITSTVSANTTSGFSIATTTGTGGTGTFGHGLGVTPSLIIPFRRSDADSRWVFHKDVGPTKGIALDTNALPTTSVNFWNNTAPTSSVVNVGNTHNNSGSTYVFYCFAEVEGFSKIGSYVGNGSSDGPFIYCGFRPSWVLIKQATTSARDWIIQDASRNPYNVANLQLLPNTNQAEATTFFSQSAEIDILSNGFKVRSGAARVSESGATYIVAAFAENPFKTANAR
jgi:hypothetical protein